ncbi:acetyl-CoA decarbonylase/synthase complex subunit delta [Chloroflexota bacterium]
MQYTAPVETYSGQVREVTIGKGAKALKIGGESNLPFHTFDNGALPNKAVFALEVLDIEPSGWAAGLVESLKDVMSDPVKWAEKGIKEFGADAIFLRLESTDPTGNDASPEEAAATVKKVVDAVDVPVIVFGAEDEKKDVLVLKKVAEVCSGENLLLGPVVKENYEEIAQAASEHGHSLIALTPMDINLMKELNIKLAKIFPAERIVIDPVSSAVGYGMEYSFTIMERTKLIGVQHKDAMTQMPIIANLGFECWKTREAKESKEQGILWEGATALSMLLAGANLLVLRHPETLKLVKEMTA